MLMECKHGLCLVVRMGTELIEEERQSVLIVCYETLECGVRGVEVGYRGMLGGDLRV